MVTEQQIKELAYAIWEEEGRPEGKDVEHYFRARRILEERQASSFIELTPSPISQLPRRPPTPELAPPVAEVPPGQYKRRRRTRPLENVTRGVAAIVMPHRYDFSY